MNPHKLYTFMYEWHNAEKIKSYYTDLNNVWKLTNEFLAPFDDTGIIQAHEVEMFAFCTFI